MRRRVLTFVLLLAAGATAAAAQPAPPPQPTEAAPPIDMGADGALLPPELVFTTPAGEPFRSPMGAPYPVADWFALADADHDGALTSAEFAADSGAFFARLDSDRDGRVDGFENADYEKAIAPEITGVMRRPPARPSGGGSNWRPMSRADAMWGRMPFLSPGPNGPKGPPKRQGAAQYGLLNEPHPVRGADADLDGKVTRAEAEAAARRRFALLDLDGDGRLVLADLPKTPAQLAFGEPEAPPRRKP